MSDYDEDYNELKLVSTGLKHFCIDDDDAAGSSSDQKIIEGTPKPIEEFCKQICDALYIKTLGYANEDDLAADVFEDTGLDPYRVPQTFGYETFADFLRSKHMQPYIDIDDSDGITTYHCPMSRIKKEGRNDIHVEQEGFFDDLNNRRKRRPGFQMDKECPNATALLYERYCKRMGKPPPPKGPNPPMMQPAGAGRGRRNPEEMRKREFEQFLNHHPELRKYTVDEDGNKKMDG